MGREPRLPNAALQYLVAYLMEVGPTSAGGFGAAPITHQEILAWQVNMHRMLQPWEISMLRRLSVEWVAEDRRAEDPDAAAPWDDAITPEELGAVAVNLRDRIRGMAQR